MSTDVFRVRALSIGHAAVGLDSMPIVLTVMQGAVVLVRLVNIMLMSLKSRVMSAVIVIIVWAVVPACRRTFAAYFPAADGWSSAVLL